MTLRRLRAGLALAAVAIALFPWAALRSESAAQCGLRCCPRDGKALCCLLLKGTGLECHQDEAEHGGGAVLRRCGPEGTQPSATAPTVLRPAVTALAASVAVPSAEADRTLPADFALPLSFALAPDPPPPRIS